MSRHIQTTDTLRTDASIPSKSERGTLLFTECCGRQCAILFKNNRILAIRPLDLSSNTLVDSIYIGRIQNYNAAINAYFVEYQPGRMAFLPTSETTCAVLTNRESNGQLHNGDELIIQITRDAQKTKLPAATTRINLSDERLALTLGNRHIGYSSKLSKEQKETIHNHLKEARLIDEKGFFCGDCEADFSGVSGDILRARKPGLVVRTEAKDAGAEELFKSCAVLLRELSQLLTNGLHKTAFTCLRQPPSPLERALQEIAYTEEYDQILTDDKNIYEYLLCSLTENGKLKYYEDPEFSLGKLFSLDQKAEDAFRTRIWLKSGAYLVIEYTEAMTVIDVNSGKYEVKRASEDYFLKLNMEAAAEVVRQLRLRNLSGMILVDFVNMQEAAYRQELLRFLRRETSLDRIKTEVVDITALGLVEITRQKHGKPLYEEWNNRRADIQ